MKKTNQLLTLRVMVALLCMSASRTVLAANYPNGILSDSSIVLHAGDTVTSTSTGLESTGSGNVLIYGDPTITVTGASGTGEAKGILIRNSSKDNLLGTGTIINVTNQYGNAYGLVANGDAPIISGSNVTFNVTGNDALTHNPHTNGVSIESPISVDLGNNSKINIVGNSSAVGIDMTSPDSAFKANGLQLTISSSGQYFHGTYVNSLRENTVIDLGTGSSLKATGTESIRGIYLHGFGSSLTAKGLTVFSTNAEAILADNGATINISDNSELHITGANSYPFGVFSGETSPSEKGVTESTINLSDSMLLQTGGTDVTGIGASDGIVNLNNFTFKQKDVDSTSYGFWSLNGEININSVNFQQNGGLYGLVVTQGGKMTLMGENNLQTENVYLMFVEGADSSITGSGKETLVGSLKAENSGTINLTMTDGSNWSGAATIGTPGASGTFDLSIEGNSIWNMTGNSTISSLGLTNGATVNLSASAKNSTRHTLTIVGDYIGSAGKFVFNGDLNGDTNSSVDQLVINGNVVPGKNKTRVSVNNIGGLGEKTIEGIKIITVTGDSPDAFVKDGRIVAGAYDYYLQQGNANGEDTKNWYLTNELSPITPSVRPEVGSYLGNLYAANNMFQTSLHDRLGEVAFTENEDKNNDVWARFDTRKVNVKTNLGGLDIGQTYNAVQFGYDFLHKEYGKGNKKSFFVAGIMGGYGDTSTTAKGTAYNAGGSLHGFSVGPYATWYRESPHKSGTYADVWALWNRFDGSTNGEGIDSESYRLQGMVLSAEVGYDQLLSKRASQNESNRFLKWQGQITYQGVDGGNKVESNGTVVDLSNRNVQTRLGVRYYSKPNGEKESYNQPYVELNWYHNTKPVEIQMDETKVELQGTDNIGEIKIGTEYKLRKSMELWGYGFYAKGGSGYDSYGARIGIKTMF